MTDSSAKPGRFAAALKEAFMAALLAFVLASFLLGVRTVDAPGGLSFYYRPKLLITGHLGNWELLGYFIALLGFPIEALARTVVNETGLDPWRIELPCQARALFFLGAIAAGLEVPETVSGFHENDEGMDEDQD